MCGGLLGGPGPVVNYRIDYKKSFFIRFRAFMSTSLLYFGFDHPYDEGVEISAQS